MLDLVIIKRLYHFHIANDLCLHFFIIKLQSEHIIYELLKFLIASVGAEVAVIPCHC